MKKGHYQLIRKVLFIVIYHGSKYLPPAWINLLKTSDDAADSYLYFSILSKLPNKNFTTAS